MFVELPDEGTNLEMGGKFGSVESVKAVSDVISPISGTVIEINTTLADSPDVVSGPLMLSRP